MSLHVASPAAVSIVLSVVCAFVLRVTAGYVLCLLLARFATSAAMRFAIWLSFLFAAATYWLFSVAQAYEVFSTGAASGMRPASAVSGFPVALSMSTAEVLGRFFVATMCFYLAALLALVILGLWKRVQLYFAIRHRVLPSSELKTAFHKVAWEIQAPPCSVWLLPGLSSPASVGWLTPAIYLPADEKLEETADLHQILLHELSHIRRRDGLWETLARLCRCVVFFHPFIHKAFSSLRLERELACDLVVVRSNPGTRDFYADMLLRFGWKTSAADQPDHIGIGFTSQSAVLTARIQSILRGERVYSKWSSAARAILSTGACWSFAAIVPALWVGFSLSLLDTPILSSVSPETQVHRHVHHRLREHLHLDQVPAQVPSAVTPSLTEPPPQVAIVAPTHPRYHIQNEDEPMSNPVGDPDSPGVPETPGSASSRKFPRAGSPSAMSVFVDAATRLASMGGGDHDRGHDHN